MTRRPLSVLVSCEHGGHRVPREFAPLFAGHAALLESHRGWDPGALELARRVARTLDVPCLAVLTTRLLVEINRSPHHPRLFSELTRHCPPDIHRRLIERYYTPHRARVEQHIDAHVRDGGCVVHLGVHSFTPVMDGIERTTDIGLLYDPARQLERRFCEHWQAALKEADASLRVHRNRPYRGAADGLTTFLRTRFPAGAYLGLELEVNQRFPFGGGRAWRSLQRTLVDSFQTALQHTA